MLDIIPLHNYQFSFTYRKTPANSHFYNIVDLINTEKSQMEFIWST